MGVRGFLTFLKNNEFYLADKVQVRDTTVVIDANNLLCQIFTDMTLDPKSDHYHNDIYGGDLVAYGAAVKRFFEALEQCNITPILVFDGSAMGCKDLDGVVASKEKELYRRGLDKFTRAKSLNEFNTTDEILLPQTLNVAFRTVSADFGVQRIQAPYEADSHIARVANELNCPVLTNDSDFMIYKLKKGFLLLDYFNYKRPMINKATGKACIEAMLYSQDKMAKSVPGLSKDCMPLLSILLGNDYVEPSVFDGIMRSVSGRQYDGFFETRSHNHRKVANLLLWMRRRSLQECIDFVLMMVHHTHRERLEKLINYFMRSYHIEIEDDFDAELERIFPSDRVDPSLKELKQTPVTFLRANIENTDLSSMALDIIFHNTHYNYSVSDDFTLPSSSYVKFRPLSLAITLLRPQSYENLTTYRRRIQGERDAFRIFDRLKGEYAQMIVRPMEDLENFGPLLHLDCYNMITLEPALKRSLLMNCFRFNQEEFNLMKDTLSVVLAGPFVPEATICFILVKYIGLETKLPPKPQFVNALTITLFYYAALSGDLNSEGIPTDNAFGQLLLRLRPHAITNNGKTYANRDQQLYRRIIHFISQLQNAYKAYYLINALLGHMFHQPRQDRFFNATLIFRLTKFFRLKEETVETLCRDLPNLIDVCESLQTLVLCASS